MYRAELKAVAELDEFLRSGAGGEDVGDGQGAVKGDAVDGVRFAKLIVKDVLPDLVCAVRHYHPFSEDPTR